MAALYKFGAMATWMQQQPNELIKQCETWVLGK